MLHYKIIFMANPLLWFNPYYLKHKNFSSVFSRHFVFSHVILCFLTSFCVFYCCKLLILLAKIALNKIKQE